MELISRTWNQLPDSVRYNTCKHYLPLVNTNEIRSVMGGIVSDHGIIFGERGDDGFSTLIFTEEQWVYFLLKWS